MVYENVPKFSRACPFIFLTRYSRDGQRLELGNLRDIICKLCLTLASFHTSYAQPPFRPWGALIVTGIGVMNSGG